MTATSQIARNVTKALRAIWPAPIALRSTFNTDGNLEVTMGAGGRQHASADQVIRRINDATGQQWTFTSVVLLRGSSRARATYAPARGWQWCNQLDGEHAEHGEAVTPECLLPLPDQDLVGPRLHQVTPSRWAAIDGVEIVLNADGTYDGWGLHQFSYRDNICGNQPTLTSTYRRINTYRAGLVQRRNADHILALKIIEARADHAAAEIVVARAKHAHQGALEARRPGTYEARLIDDALDAEIRARLTLAIVEGRAGSHPRMVISEASEDGGTTWETIWRDMVDSKAFETADEQAARYAEEHFLRGKAWRVKVYTDPAAATPDGMWTNLPEQPCPAGRHQSRGTAIQPGVRRDDGSLLEAARCTTCFQPLWRVTPYGSQPYPWLIEGEELPPIEPGVLYLAIALITTDHYGMQINDGLGTWHHLDNVGAFNPQTAEVTITVDGVAVPMPGGAMVQLRPAPPGDDAGLGLGGPDDTQTQTPAQTQTTPEETINAGRGLTAPGLSGKGLTGGEIRYRVQTQTNGWWRSVQTGTTPADVRPDLDALAETILGNAGPILGLTSAQTLPPLRIQTWHWPTGQTATTNNLTQTRRRKEPQTP